VCVCVRARARVSVSRCIYDMLNDVIYHMIYLFTAIGLTPGSSSTVQIYQKQVTEQRNETEYAEYYIHNNKNT
jgi:hypothetical protein